MCTMPELVQSYVRHACRESDYSSAETWRTKFLILLLSKGTLCLIGSKKHEEIYQFDLCAKDMSKVKLEIF